MGALSLYEDFKHSKLESVSSFVESISIKEKVFSDLLTTNIESFSDVERVIIKVIKELREVNLPDICKKDVMIQCFKFIESCEEFLYPLVGGCDISKANLVKYDTLLDISKGYLKCVSDSYDKLDANTKYLNKGYFVRKVKLISTIIDMMEAVCVI